MGDHQCVLCPDFVTSDQAKMKRHVAIHHGEGTFSTLRCDVCQKNHYDFDHFQEHVRQTTSCFTNCFKITPTPLNENLEKAFLSLVEQMMTPIRSENASISSTSALPSTSINQTGDPDAASNGFFQQGIAESSNTDHHRQSTSQASEHQIEVSRLEHHENSGPLKIISVQSLAYQGHFVDQTPMKYENVSNWMDYSRADATEDANVVESIMTQELSIEDTGADIGEEMVDQKAPWSFGRFKSAKMVTDQSLMEDSGHSSDQKQTRRNIIKPDLATHCQKIIRKRQHAGRLTCSICKGSISVYDKTNSMRPLNAICHIRGHLEPCYNCKLCDFKSRWATNMRAHVAKQHQAGHDQYIDSTDEHLDELMKMATRCFDHNLKAENLAKGHRFLNDQQGVEIRGSKMDETTREITPRVTMMDGLKLRINFSAKRNGIPNRVKRLHENHHGRNGQSTWRNNRGRHGASASGKKSHGNKSRMVKNARHKMLPKCSRGKNNITTHRSPLPDHIQLQKQDYSTKVRKLIRNGKLYCNLCQNHISVSKNGKNPEVPENVNMETAIRHATFHLNKPLFECITCHCRLTTKPGIYSHTRRWHGHDDERGFIDHSTDHYQEILDKFLACFDISHVEEQQTRETGPVVDPTLDQSGKKWLVCGKCGYKSTFQMLFRMHERRMHGEQMVSS